MLSSSKKTKETKWELLQVYATHPVTQSNLYSFLLPSFCYVLSFVRGTHVLISTPFLPCPPLTVSVFTILLMVPFWSYIFSLYWIFYISILTWSWLSHLKNKTTANHFFCIYQRIVYTFCCYFLTSLTSQHPTLISVSLMYKQISQKSQWPLYY